MNVEGLRYAQAVAETGSFSGAARAYGVTQPALSNGIARLEEHLGGRLFERSTRGVTPTALGLHLLPKIGDALHALDLVASEATRWHGAPSESMRVGVSPLINPRLIARAYEAIRASSGSDGPGELVLREANLAELRKALVSGELDLIIIPSVGPLPLFEHRIIDSEPLVLLETDSPSSEPIEIAELARRELILVPDTCGLTTFTRDLLSSHHLAMRSYPGEALSYRVLEEWSALGLGAAILPASRLTDPARAARPILDDGVEVEIFYEAVWDKKALLATELRALVGALEGH